MTEWKNMKLSEMFSEEELEDLRLILREKDWELLKKWLNEEKRKEALKQKGILADYLYYVLFSEFNK